MAYSLVPISYTPNYSIDINVINMVLHMNPLILSLVKCERGLHNGLGEITDRGIIVNKTMICPDCNGEHYLIKEECKHINETECRYKSCKGFTTRPLPKVGDVYSHEVINCDHIHIGGGCGRFLKVKSVSIADETYMFKKNGNKVAIVELQ